MQQQLQISIKHQLKQQKLKTITKTTKNSLKIDILKRYLTGFIDLKKFSQFYIKFLLKATLDFIRHKKLIIIE